MSMIVEGAVIVSLDDDVPPIVVSPTVEWDDVVGKPTLLTTDTIDAAIATVPERARDAIGTALVAGTNVSISVSDAADTITISANVPAQAWTSITGKPTFSTVATTGSYTDLSNKPTIPSTTGLATTAALDAAVAAVPEQARDTLAAALVAGAGVTVVADDNADTITISATGGGGGISTEEAQDAVAAMLAAGTHSGITFVYNDASNSLAATVAAQAWSAITGKPSFATVATSGSASDITTGTLTDAVIPAAIARDSEVTSQLSGKANTAHTHGVSDLTATGTKDTTTFLRGDNTFAVPPGSGTVSDATTGAKGIVQLAGDFGGTAASPTVVRRAPIGGVQAPSYAATITPNAANGTHMRVVATGALTVNTPTGGVDGQRMLIEVQASGADRVVTFAGGYENSQAVPSSAFTILSGTWGYFAVVLRSATWRLVSAEPQTVLPPVPSGWAPADYGVLAWTADPATAASNIAISTSGTFLGSIIKLDQAATVSNIIYAVTTAGATLTANTNYIGIYSVTSGSLLAQTADQSTAWTTTGVKTTPVLTPVALAVGEYLIAHICTATTKPALSASSAAGGLTSYGRTTSSYRGYFSSTVYTALPATRPVAIAPVNPILFGLS